MNKHTNKTCTISTMCHLMGGGNDMNQWNKLDYWSRTVMMVKSYMKHTPHNIHLVTNIPFYFEDQLSKFIKQKRVILDPVPNCFQTHERFDYTTKFKAIERASKLDTDALYWIDCDLYTEGWCEKTFQELLEDTQYDMWGTIPMHHEIDQIREDRLIFSNRDKLMEMIDRWNDDEHWESLLGAHEKTFEPIEDWRCIPGSDGRILGSTIKDTNTIYRHLNPTWKHFATYERVIHRHTNEIRDREWQVITEPFQVYHGGFIYTRNEDTQTP